MPGPDSEVLRQSLNVHGVMADVACDCNLMLFYFMTGKNICLFLITAWLLLAHYGANSQLDVTKPLD